MYEDPREVALQDAYAENEWEVSSRRHNDWEGYWEAVADADEAGEDWTAISPPVSY